MSGAVRVGTPAGLDAGALAAARVALASARSALPAALCVLGLGAAMGGAGEACRTVEATLASRTVVVTDADLEGYRMVGATLASRTVATLPALEGFLTVAGILGSRTVAALAALEGFLTVAATLGSLATPFDLERADAGLATSAGAAVDLLSTDRPLLGTGASLAGGGRGGGGARGTDAAADREMIGPVDPT